jgi:hypothetical protein
MHASNPVAVLPSRRRRGGRQRRFSGLLRLTECRLRRIISCLALGMLLAGSLLQSSDTIAFLLCFRATDMVRSEPTAPVLGLRCVPRVGDHRRLRAVRLGQRPRCGG